MILSEDQWSVLWDHLVTTGPRLSVCLLPATLAVLRSNLQDCKSPREVQHILTCSPDIDISLLLTTAHSYLHRHRVRIDFLIPDCSDLFSGGNYPQIQNESGRRVLE